MALLSLAVLYCRDAVKPVLEELTAEGSTDDVSEQVVTSEPKPKAATSPASLKDPEPSKSDPRKVIERKPSKIDTPKGRPINGFSVTPGPEVTANDNEHRRYKRSSVCANLLIFVDESQNKL